jgi:hypothetical protein
MKQPRRQSCAKIFRHLCDNLDEGLNSHRCRAIKKHMEECANCMIYLDTLRKTIELYRRYPAPRLSKKTHHKIITSFKIQD